jgi:hypothetical protein
MLNKKWGLLGNYNSHFIYLAIWARQVMRLTEGKGKSPEIIALTEVGIF